MNRPTVLALLALLAAPAASHAQQQPRRGARPRPQPAAQAEPQRPAAEPELEPPSAPTPDADTIIQAIQTAAVASNADGARSIGHLLLRGVPPRAAAAGLDALGVMGRPEGAPAVLRFLEHRRASLRRHAVAAAQAIHTPELVRALAGKLGDADEDVRVETATALGEVGDPIATERLFAALERELEDSAASGRLLHECARSIGRIGAPADIERLLGYLRRAPFRAMSDGMRAALARRDLPEPLKLRVVSAVGDLATAEAREFLNAVVEDAGGQTNAVVRAARTAADRIAQ